VVEKKGMSAAAISMSAKCNGADGSPYMDCVILDCNPI